MLKVHRTLYVGLIAGLPLRELPDLYERCKDYPALNRVVEAEIDRRLSRDPSRPSSASSLRLENSARCEAMTVPVGH